MFSNGTKVYIGSKLNKAIIYYASFYDYQLHKSRYKDFPIYLKVEFTVKNILKLRKSTASDVIVTSAITLELWRYKEEYLNKLDPNYLSAHTYIFLSSFTREELEELINNPRNYIVLEVYNGLRE